MCIAFGACILKYVLFIVNLILTLFGLGVLALGIFALVKLSEISFLGTILIVVGCIITVIFFLGCCGAITKNNCMLISYTVIIVILAVLTVVLTVFLSKQKESVKEIVSNEFDYMFNSTESFDTINAIEYALKCCGTTGPGSYANSTLPISCCPDAASNIEAIQTSIQGSNITNIVGNEITACSVEDAYQVGCQDLVVNEAMKAFEIVINVLICICIGEFIAAAIAIALTCYNRRKRKA